MEGEEGYSVPEGIQLYSFSSASSLSQVSAATGGVINAANEDPRSEEKKRNEKQEKEIRTTLKDIFQLANYYIVFQGVIFTSIFSNPSPLKCQYRWLPISLSLVAGLMNLSILIHWMRMYFRLRFQREVDLAGVGSRPVPDYLKDRHESRRVIAMICLLMFVLFLGIILIGSWEILCYESGYSQHYNVKNCFEPCNDYGRCTLICLNAQ